MSLSNLTHDELRDHIAAGLTEAESRLSGRRLKTLKLAHALLDQVDADSVDAGDLQARGGGTDKETPPT